MKKNDYCMVKPLSGEEYAQISGVMRLLQRNK